MEITSLQPRVTWMQGNVRVSYEASRVDISGSEGWPPYLAAMPSVGDVVESTGGRRLQIKEVIHTIEDRKATVKLVLGVDSGGITPMEGGASYVAMEPE